MGKRRVSNIVKHSKAIRSVEDRQSLLPEISTVEELKSINDYKFKLYYPKGFTLSGKAKEFAINNFMKWLNDKLPSEKALEFESDFEGTKILEWCKKTSRLGSKYYMVNPRRNFK